MPPLKHSDLGASAASRWISCPASVRLTQLARENNAGKPEKQTVFAAEGSIAHHVCEELLLGRATPEQLLGKAVMNGGYEIVISQEMLDAAKLYVDTVKLYAKGEIFVEKQISIPWLHKDFFGTVDCFSRSENALYVFDFKYGKGVDVDAYDNPQLKYYALGCLGPDAKHDLLVNMFIVQPRTGEGVKIYQTTAGNLYRWAHEVLVPAARAAEDENAPQIPSEKACRWCKGAPYCKALLKASECQIEKFFPPELPDGVPLPPANLLTNTEISNMLLAINKLKAYGEKLSEEARARILAGQRLNNIALKRGRATRLWTDPDEAEATLAGLLGEGAYKKTLLSPAQAEKVLDKNLVSRMVTVKEGEPTLTFKN